MSSKLNLKHKNLFENFYKLTEHLRNCSSLELPNILIKNKFSKYRNIEIIHILNILDLELPIRFKTPAK